MVCAHVRSIIPSLYPLAKARGLSLRTGAQTMLYLSLVVCEVMLVKEAAV